MPSSIEPDSRSRLHVTPHPSHSAVAARIARRRPGDGAEPFRSARRSQARASGFRQLQRCDAAAGRPGSAGSLHVELPGQQCGRPRPLGGYAKLGARFRPPTARRRPLRISAGRGPARSGRSHGEGGTGLSLRHRWPRRRLHRQWSLLEWHRRRRGVHGADQRANRLRVGGSEHMVRDRGHRREGAGEVAVESRQADFAEPLRRHAQRRNTGDHGGVALRAPVAQRHEGAAPLGQGHPRHDRPCHDGSAVARIQGAAAVFGHRQLPARERACRLRAALAHRTKVHRLGAPRGCDENSSRRPDGQEVAGDGAR